MLNRDLDALKVEMSRTSERIDGLQMGLNVPLLQSGGAVSSTATPNRFLGTTTAGVHTLPPPRTANNVVSGAFTGLERSATPNRSFSAGTTNDLIKSSIARNSSRSPNVRSGKN